MRLPRGFTLDELFRYREELPPILISRLLHVGNKLILGGQAKKGKSFLLHNLLHSLTTGRPVFGCPEFVVPSPQPGVLFSQELGPVDLQSRWLKLLDLPDRELLLHNLVVVPHDGQFRLDAPQTGGTGSMAYILNQAREKLGGRIAWIALDPISKFHAQDENQQHTVAGIMRELETMQQAFGNPGLILVHHHGHMTKEKAELRSGGDLLRGSSHWYADADTIVTVRRVSPMRTFSPKFELDFETRHGAPLGIGQVQLLGHNMSAQWLQWKPEEGEA